VGKQKDRIKRTLSPSKVRGQKHQGGPLKWAPSSGGKATRSLQRLMEIKLRESR